MSALRLPALPSASSDSGVELFACEICGGCMQADADVMRHETQRLKSHAWLMARR